MPRSAIDISPLNNFRRALRSLAVCAIVTLLQGCREAPTTVTGLVTLDGKPLAVGDGMRGSVVFQPTASGGVTLTGLIDKTGHYELSSGGSGTVAPSVYLVTVSATELIPATDDRPTSGKLLTPTKYASAMDSGFRIEVVSGKNEVNLPLVSDADLPAVEAPPQTPDEPATPGENAPDNDTETGSGTKPRPATTAEPSTTE